MVNKALFQLRLIVVISCLAWAHAQGQYSQAIQQQMNAAGAQYSSATSPTYATPLATFQTYFNAVQTLNVASLCGTLTSSNGLSSVFDTTPPSTTSDYASLSTAMAAGSPTNYVLTSFVFHTDPTRPTITAAYTHTVTVNGHTSKLTDNIVLTLVDTAQGWMIDNLSDK